MSGVGQSIGAHGGRSGRGRILFVTSSFPRWAGDSTTPFVYHLAQDLQAIGWDVDVLAPHAAGAAGSETLGGVSVRRFRYLWPDSLETVCYQGGALINLRRSRANVLKLPALVGAECAAVIRLLATGRYDLVHSHWILPQGFVDSLCAKLLKVKHVLTVHGGDVFALRGRAMEAFKKFALSRADAVTVNSSATEAAVRRLVPGARHLHRIPMGVAVRRPGAADVAEVRTRYRRGDGPLLLFVGRLIEEKGVGDLLAAISLLRPRLPDLTALVVGEGQDREQFESVAANQGLLDRVTFAGWVDSVRLPAYFAAADVFVGPSRTGRDGWIEAQGLTFLEAMAVGAPVIASRLGGIVDAVRHEETGLLVDERSPEQIALAVERLQHDHELRQRIIANAARAVAEGFTREKCAERFSALFSGLVHPAGERAIGDA